MVRQLINVTLTKDPEGLGMKLGYQRGKLLITRFQELPGGRKGPAEECGLLRPLDVLIAVDGETLTGFLFSQAINKIKAAPRTFSMTFARTVPERFIKRYFDVAVPEEFLAEALLVPQDAAVEALFQILDKDHNDTVSREELATSSFGDEFQGMLQ